MREPSPRPLVAGGEHDSGRVWQQGEDVGHIGAVAVREQYVEQYKVWLELAGRVDGGRGSARLTHDDVPAALQQQAGHPAEAGMVVDEEHRAGHD